ncbi:6270_t:CDS:1, partial [Racocetra fulgida]
NISEDKTKNSISIEYDNENIKYETNFLATNFPIQIESDPNDTLCLLLTV